MPVLACLALVVGAPPPVEPAEGRELQMKEHPYKPLSDLAFRDPRCYNAVAGEANLEGEMCDFGGYDLSGLDLSRGDFRHSCFEGADVTGTKFRQAMLEDTSWYSARCVDAKFDRAILDVSNFDFVDCTMASFIETRMHMTTFISADLRGVTLSKAAVGSADFTGATLESAMAISVRWEHTILNRAIFTNAELMEGTFDGTFCDGTQFTGANLERSRFSKSDLCGARFDHTKLDGSTFSADTSIQQAAWLGASLRGAEFRSLKQEDPTSASGRGVLTRTVQGTGGGCTKRPGTSRGGASEVSMLGIESGASAAGVGRGVRVGMRGAGCSVPVGMPRRTAGVSAGDLAKEWFPGGGTPLSKNMVPAMTPVQTVSKVGEILDYYLGVGRYAPSLGGLITRSGANQPPERASEPPPGGNDAQARAPPQGWTPPKAPAWWVTDSEAAAAGHRDPQGWTQPQGAPVETGASVQPTSWTVPGGGMDKWRALIGSFWRHDAAGPAGR